VNKADAGGEVEAIFIAGPTACGKSAAALRLAEGLGGEIISVDSMQVYRGMDIGTAKATKAEQERVRHHLIDVAVVAESFDAAQFLALAREAEAEIRGRRRRPIFCGGTGLYFKALAAGLGEGPPSDPKLRAELEGMPLAELLEELERKDLATFMKMDQANTRRVVRAVEVVRLTGRAFSAQRADWSEVREKRGRWFGLERMREDLVRRMDARVERMFKEGLVEETRGLMGKGLEQNRTAMQAIGYRQVVEHLRGERGLAETIERVKIKTRQFAKRQMTWFRRQLALEWIAVPEGTAGAEGEWIEEEIRRRL